MDELIVEPDAPAVHWWDAEFRPGGFLHPVTLPAPVAMDPREVTCPDCIAVAVAAVRADNARRRDEASGEHRLTGDVGRKTCTCGWEPGLGEVAWRAFDRHLADVARLRAEEADHG